MITLESFSQTCASSSSASDASSATRRFSSLRKLYDALSSSVLRLSSPYDGGLFQPWRLNHISIDISLCLFPGSSCCLSSSSSLGACLHPMFSFLPASRLRFSPTTHGLTLPSTLRYFPQAFSLLRIALALRIPFDCADRLDPVPDRWCGLCMLQRHLFVPNF